MQLVFHGGKCCGIKTIHRMGLTPNHVVRALPKVDMRYHDQTGNDVNSSLRFFHEAAPSEPALDRLNRYIDYCKKHRPKGIIEITLAESANEYDDQSSWFPLLRRRGFKCVTKAKNSNSGNIVHVFHKVYE